MIDELRVIDHGENAPREERMSTWSKNLALWVVVLATALTGLGIDDVTRDASASEGVEFDEYDVATVTDRAIVRRQLLYRAGRIELEPKVTFSLNDAYVRNGVVGLSASYFLDNSFGIGASAGFGALGMDTSLRRGLETRLQERGGSELANTAYSRVGWMLDAGLIYVPAFGKASLMNSIFSHYDIHLLGGMAIINESADSAVDGGATYPELEGIRPGGMFGLGLRFFMADAFSMNLQVRNYLFPRAEISQGNAEPRLGSMVMFSLGVGIYLPGDVQISR